MLKGDEMHGMIFFSSCGDAHSEFVAKRATEKKANRSGNERHTASYHPRLKLGKRASFVKTHLKLLAAGA